jgi:hypothetical protein
VLFHHSRAIECVFECDKEAGTITEILFCLCRSRIREVLQLRPAASDDHQAAGVINFRESCFITLGELIAGEPSGRAHSADNIAKLSLAAVELTPAPGPEIQLLEA